MVKAIVHFFPVNEEEKKEEEIRTTMQSSVAMPQSCTHGPRQLFLSSKRGGGGDYNYKAVFCCIVADLYSWQRQSFLPSE